MGDKDKSWDYLSVLSKGDIIEYLNQNIFFSSNVPTENDVKFFKWQKDSLIVQEEMKAHLKNYDKKYGPLAKERDRLAKLFNSNKHKSSKEALDILNKISLIDQKFIAREKEYKKIASKQDRLNKVIEEINRD